MNNPLNPSQEFAPGQIVFLYSLNFIALCMRYYRRYGKGLSYRKMSAHLTKLKKLEKYQHWNIPYAWALQNGISRYRNISLLPGVCSEGGDVGYHLGALRVESYPPPVIRVECWVAKDSLVEHSFFNRRVGYSFLLAKCRLGRKWVAILWREVRMIPFCVSMKSVKEELVWVINNL